MAHGAQVKSKGKGIHLLPFFGDEVIAAFSGREYASGNRPEFLEKLGIPAADLILIKQVHSANLILVTSQKRPAADCCADGMITQTPGLALGVLTADCLPVFFFDPDQKAVGIVHAGWKGVSQGIVKKAAQAFRQNFAAHPKHLKVAIGPAIRACCFEVDHEFQGMFPEFYAARKSDEVKGHVDLIAAAKHELLGEGVLEKHIFDSEICTSCQNSEFFSYRKEKQTPERMLSLICLKP